jgi:hypothetical protein
MFRTGIVQYFNLQQAREEMELEIAAAGPEKAAALRESLAQLERLSAVLAHLPQPLERSIIDHLLSYPS